MLVPAIEVLEEAMDSGNWPDVQDKASLLVQSCNSCHVTTGYDFVVIQERTDVNPFNQDFSPLQE